MAFHIYGSEITHGDKAYPYMISRILPPQLRGVMFAALCGAVMSTFNSGLNSASTIFTIDLYNKYINPNASQHRQVTVGRIATAVIVIIACLWAPVISGFEGVFLGFYLTGHCRGFPRRIDSKKSPTRRRKRSYVNRIASLWFVPLRQIYLVYTGPRKLHSQFESCHCSV
jgi:hypothetical protein